MSRVRSHWPTALAVAALLSAPACAGAAFPGGDGTIAYTRCASKCHLAEVSPAGKGLGAVGPAGAEWPDFSADGKRLAFAARPPGKDFTEIYVMDADGRHKRRVTHVGKSRRGADDPTFSPSGKRIAFTGPDSGIYVIGVDGKHKRELTHKLIAASPAWSPDGRHIAFADLGELSRRLRGQRALRAAMGESDIYVMGTSGKHMRRVTHHGADFASNPAWSPNGKTIAYDRIAGEASKVALVDASGSDDHVVPGIQKYSGTPAFSPRGNRLAYGVSQFGSAAANGIYVVALDGSNRRRLTDGENDFAPTWQPVPR